MNPRDPSNPWTTLSSRPIYDNPWIAVTEHRIVHPGGGDGIYGVVHYKHTAIGIIPVDGEGHTWLVGQFRYPLGRYSWEIPEGGGKLDVPILDSARRELSEETGLSAARWTEILRVDLSNCIGDEQGVVFIAEDLTIGEPHPDPDEKLELARVPLAEAIRMAMDGEITDSLSILGLLKARALGW